VYVIDMAGSDNREPHEDYRELVKELSLYREAMVQRPCLVVANKMDIPEAKEKLAIFEKETGCTPLQISALTEAGIDALRDALFELEQEHGQKAAGNKASDATGRAEQLIPRSGNN
jgi:GTP-binding protein